MGRCGPSAIALCYRNLVGGYQPAPAQHAIRQGRHVARNLVASLTGQNLEPHDYRGVGRVMGVSVTGFLAWFAWRTYYLFALPRWKRRFRVAFDWFLHLLFPPDIVELKVEPLPAAREELTAESKRVQEPEAEDVTAIVISGGQPHINGDCGEGT